MVKVVKHQANDGSIDYEFVGFDCWDDFDTLANILTNQMSSNIVEKLEGIYSRYLMLEKEGQIFKLMYHEDLGNCICPLSNYEEHLFFLEHLANKMLPFINESLT